MGFANSRTESSPPWQRIIPLFLSVAFLWLVLLLAEKARPCFFLHDDNATQFIGMYVHDFRVLTETGRLVEVNYYQHGGEPYIEQGQTAVLYPPVYVGVALAKWVTGDVRWSLEWIAAIHLTIGLLGFHFWLRRGGVGPWLAALGGLAWVFHPFIFIMSANWVFMSFAAAWLPWLFWAFDYLLGRPSLRPALFLGVIAGLLFLQGYVQMFAYAILFLGVYAVFQFAMKRETRTLSAFYYLGVSALVFMILALPLLLPMLHASADSAFRPGPLSLFDSLYFSCSLSDLYTTPFCRFQPCFAFGVTSVILYSPAVLFVPVTVFRFFYGGAVARRRLIPLVVLAVLALALSTHAHAALSIFPFFNKFRWPFKVFLFADFFLIASLTYTIASWSKSRLAAGAGFACLIVVAVANLGVSIASHDGNTLSHTVLPTSTSPLPPELDSRLGRIATFGQYIHEETTYRNLTHAYATYYRFPSLGGYNPLVGGELMSWALYLDFPNCCTDAITPDYQKYFEARSARYWIADPHAEHFASIRSLPNLRQLEATPDRVIFEDTQAAPLAYAKAAPTVPCALNYSGNSTLISLDGATSPVEVSVPPTDGWWYRVDKGPWQKPGYPDIRAEIDFKAPAHSLEVRYFDPRFHAGLGWSALTLVFLVLLLNAKRIYPQRSKPR